MGKTKVAPMKSPALQLTEAYGPAPTAPEPEATPTPVTPVVAETPAPAAAEAVTETPPSTLEEQLRQARAEGAAEGRRQSAEMYKGLQRSFGQVQQENAQLRQQAAQLAYIPAMSRVINELATRTLGPEESQKLSMVLENEQLKAGLQFAQQQREAAQVQTQVPTEYAPPEFEDSPALRQEVLDYHFPGEPIRTDDERIDWARDIVDSNPAAAQARFKKSVVKLLKEDAGAAVRGAAQKQVTKANDALREAGVDTTDPSLPGGPVLAPDPLLGGNPKDWNGRKLLSKYFNDADPKAIRSQRKAGVAVFAGQAN